MTLLGHPVHRFPVIPSTMDELDRLARSGAPEGTAVITDLQEQGRGRAGRTWQTMPGTALLCSVLLRPNLSAREISSLPLVAGVAIAEAIEQISGLSCSLKWPNDVFIHGKKVCGILLQARTLGQQAEFVNLGFGINVNSQCSELPDTATGLAIETGRRFDIAALESAVFARLSARYATFLAASGRPSLDGWLDRAMFMGDEVTIEQHQRAITGRLVGVARDGSLRLRTDAGEISVAIGEMTRGPRATAGAATRN
jgi:BirA family biotin operon repressor/biotin-[acetyl-CoA-carboxylase] ligase